MSKVKTSDKGARNRARVLLVQALYQMQLTDHNRAELERQFHERPEYANTETGYFDDMLAAICSDLDALKDLLSDFADRPVSILDPVELSVLLIGLQELRGRPDIPFRVVINESVNLSKRFGAADGHKYINAVLDRAAGKIRETEYNAARG